MCLTVRFFPTGSNRRRQRRRGTILDMFALTVDWITIEHKVIGKKSHPFSLPVYQGEDVGVLDTERREILVNLEVHHGQVEIFRNEAPLHWKKVRWMKEFYTVFIYSYVV